MTPRLGARFTQYELDMQPGGRMEKLVDDEFEHFIYVQRGGLTIDIGAEKKVLEEGGFAFLPDDMAYRFENPYDGQSRVLWTKQRFQPLENLRPEPIFSHEADVQYIVEDTYLEQHLIPYDDNMAYDMAFNRLWFEAGVTFGFVETHIMEHGLYLLEGWGIYYLNNEYVEMQADDYLYMYPFVPQSFAATGWTEGRYLLNKDVNRDYDGRY
jgi:(S)-ureidoglycine aminohydrolase